MNPEFDQCLKQNKIIEFSRGKVLVPKELKEARDDLETAKESLRDKRYKWCTVQSYYSMFHSARALLYEKNYRERSHYCLIVAIRALYVEKRLIPGSLVETFQKAKRLREDADYYGRWTEAGSESILKAAEKFLKIAEDLTKKKETGS